MVHMPVAPIPKSHRKSLIVITFLSIWKWCLVEKCLVNSHACKCTSAYHIPIPPHLYQYDAKLFGFGGILVSHNLILRFGIKMIERLASESRKF